MERARVNGRDIFIPNSVTTAEEIKRIAEIEPGRNLIRRERGGNYLVPNGTPFTVNPDDNFTDAPPRVKGDEVALSRIMEFFGFNDASYCPDAVSQAVQNARPVITSLPQDRNSRIYSEAMMIAPYYTKHEGIYFDEENCDWLMIPVYPLPRKWESCWCKLLIIFPDAYPITPPVGFYLNQKFGLKNGGSDPHLLGNAHHGADELQAQGWFWYCVRILEKCPGGWRPDPDYRKPDNLQTFLDMVQESLTNDY